MGYLSSSDVRVRQRGTARRLATLCAASVVIGVLAAEPADAAWSAAYTISPAGWSAADSPPVAVDRQGDATFAWTAQHDTEPANYRVQVRRRTADGRWSTTQTVSPRDQSATSFVVLGTDDDGDSVVAWQWFDPMADRWRVSARRISRSGTIGPLLTLSSPSVHADVPAVAVSPTGNALVVWRQNPPGARSKVYARRIGLDSTLGSPFYLGAEVDGSVDVAMDRRGYAVAAWPDGHQLRARRITPTSTGILRDLTLPNEGGYYWVNVDVDADGDATIGFRAVNQVDSADRFWVRRYRRTGEITAARQVSPTDHTTVAMNQVSVDLQGDTILVWSRQVNREYYLYGRQYTASGSLSPMVKLGRVTAPKIWPDDDGGGPPHVALDDDGNGALIYTVPGGELDEHNVIVRRVGQGGSFGYAHQLSSDAGWPMLDTSPTGRVTSAWVKGSQPYPVQYARGT